MVRGLNAALSISPAIQREIVSCALPGWAPVCNAPVGMTVAPRTAALSRPTVMRRHRDNQRSRVYAWERAALRELGARSISQADFEPLSACEAWALPVWRKERGRVGLARVAAPAIERPTWGQRRALAHDDHRITLPRWARSRWVILHELAHRLTPRDEAHEPRFVGVLIGLVGRWLEYDAAHQMGLADERGVRYYVRRGRSGARACVARGEGLERSDAAAIADGDRARPLDRPRRRGDVQASARSVAVPRAFRARALVGQAAGERSAHDGR